MFTWKELAKKKKFSVLAPMEDVTDTVFRHVLMHINAAPDLFYTEFTNLEGLFSVGSEEVAHRLKYSEDEKPLIAQVWGTTPSLYERGAKKIKEMGFDGIDINMGCPVDKVIKKGACSALIKNPILAREIIESAQYGADSLPLSIKTRIGFDEIQTEEWIGHLLLTRPQALIVHVRTVKDQSRVPARWEEMEKVVKLRNEISPSTVLVVNGDISSVSLGEELANKYGFEGYMIGRGVFSNPWVFNKDIMLEDKSIADRVEVLKYHVSLFEQTWGSTKNFSILKKYFKIYISNFEGASEFRNSLMETKNFEDLSKVIDDYSPLFK